MEFNFSLNLFSKTFQAKIPVHLFRNLLIHQIKSHRKIGTAIVIPRLKRKSLPEESVPIRALMKVSR